MKVPVIFLSSLLCWSFVSSASSNDKSANESSNVNDGESDSAKLATKETSDDASSAKDWEEKLLNSFDQKDLNGTDGKDDRAGKKLILATLIAEGWKVGKEIINEAIGGVKELIEILKSESKLADIPLFRKMSSNNGDQGDIAAWIQNGIDTLFANHDHQRTASTSQTNQSVDEKTETKHSSRVKRDLRTTFPTLEHPRNNPRKESISEHVLNLNEGSKSNVLKSKKATIGRSAIRRILARAQAKAAAQHKNVYDNRDFRKWFLSGSSFDPDIFKRPFHRSSFDAGLAERSNSEGIGAPRHGALSISHHPSTISMHKERMKPPFARPYDSTENVDAERSYATLLRKSGYQEGLSPKVQITSPEKHGRETDEMYRIFVPSHRRRLAHEDVENIGQRYTPSHARVPHVRYYMSENDETENTPEWYRVKWADINPSEAHASHALRSAKSRKFETSGEAKENEEEEEEEKGFGRKWIFRTSFEPGIEQEEANDDGIQSRHKADRKILTKTYIHGQTDHRDSDEEETVARTKSGRHRYDIVDRETFPRGTEDTFDNVMKQHLTDSSHRYTSSIDSSQEEDVRSKDKHREYGEVRKESLWNALTTEISTNPTEKFANIDVERNHWRDQKVAAAATSSSPNLPDRDVHSRRTNNISPSVNEMGSDTVDNYGVRGKSHDTTDKQATSTEIGFSFDGTGSHSRSDSSHSTRSSTLRAHSEARSGNREEHRVLSEYQRSIANAVVPRETEYTADKDTQLGQATKAQRTLSAKEYENACNYHDQEDHMDVDSMTSTEASTTDSVRNKYPTNGLEVSPSSTDRKARGERGRHLLENWRIEHSAKYADEDERAEIMELSDDLNANVMKNSRNKERDSKENREAIAKATLSTEAMPIKNERAGDLLRTVSSEDSRAADSTKAREEHKGAGLSVRYHGTPRHKSSIEVIDIDDRSSEAYISTPEFSMRKFGKRYPSGDVHIRDFKDRRMLDEQEVGSHDEFARDKVFQRKEIDYDGTTHEEEQFVTDTGISGDSDMNVSNERNSHGQRNHHSKHEAHDRLNGHKHYSHHGQLHQHVQRNKHGEHNQHRQHGQHNDLRDFDHRVDGATSSSSLSDKNQLEAWNKYLYLIREQENKQANAAIGSSASANKKSNERNNSVNEEISLSQRRGEKRVNNGDDNIWMKKRMEGWSIEADNSIKERINNAVRNKIGTTKETTINEDAGESNEDNLSEHHENKRTKDGTYGGFVIGIESQLNHDEESINKDIYYQKNSRRPTTLEGTNPSTQIKRVHGRGKEDVDDVDREQRAETIEFSDPNSAVQALSRTSSTSYSYGESQTEGEQHASKSDNNEASYQTSLSSKSAVESQMENEHRERSRNRADAVTSREAAFFNNGTNEFESSVQDTVTSSQSSAEYRAKSRHYLDNSRDSKRYDVTAEASTDARSSTYAKGTYESRLEGASSVSKSSVQSQGNIEDLRVSKTSTVDVDASSASRIADPSVSSGAQTRTVSIPDDFESNEINADSSASSEATFSKNSRHEHQSHSKKASSTSSSTHSEAESHAKSVHHSRNNQMNIANVQTSSKSTSLDSTDRGQWTDSSKSIEENKHDSNEGIETVETVSTKHRSASESAIKDKIHEDYSKIMDSRNENVIDTKASSKSNGSVRMKNEYKSKLQDTLSFSKSSAESQVEDGHYPHHIRRNRKENIEVAPTSAILQSNDHQCESTDSTASCSSHTKAHTENEDNETSSSSTVSKNVVKETSQRNSLHALSLSQISERGYLSDHKDDTKTAENLVTLNSIDSVDDLKHHSDGRKVNISKTELLIDRANEDNSERFVTKQSIGRNKVSKEDLGGTAASVKKMTLDNSKSIQNVTRSSSSIDSKEEARAHVERNWSLSREEKITMDDPELPAISRISNEIKDNRRNELLKTSSLSDMHSKLHKKDMHFVDIIQNGRGSIATLSNEQLQNETVEKMTSKSDKRTKKTGNDHETWEKDLKDITSQVTTGEKSINLNLDNISENIPAVSYKEMQIIDDLQNKIDASISNSAKSRQSTALRNNKHEDGNDILKLKLLHGKGNIERKLDSRTQIEDLEDATFHSFDGRDQNDLTETDNIDAGISQRDKHKSNAAWNGDFKVGMTTTFSRQKHPDNLLNVQYLGDSYNEMEMKNGDTRDEIIKELSILDNKQSKEDNSVKTLFDEERVKNKNTQHISQKNMDNLLASTETVVSNIRNDHQDDPLIAFITDTQNNHRQGFMSTVDSENPSDTIDVPREEKIANSNARDSISDSRTNVQNAVSSYIARDEDEITAQTDISSDAKDSVKGNRHDLKSHGKSSFLSSNVIPDEKYIRGDRKAHSAYTAETETSAETSIANDSPNERDDDAKDAATRQKHNYLNVRKAGEAIASSVPLSSEDGKSSETRTVRQDSSKTVEWSNSRAETRHVNINDITRKSSEIVASDATSSGKIKSGSRGNPIRDSSTSNSHANSQTDSDLDISRDSESIAGIVTSAESGLFNHRKNPQQEDLIDTNSLSDPDHDIYMESGADHVPEDKFGKTADATARGMSRDIVKDERRNGIMKASSLTNSRAQTQTEYEYNSSIRGKSMASFSGTEAREAKSKDTIDNEEEVSKLAASTAEAATNVENISERDRSDMLSLFDSYAESRIGNARSQNVIASKHRQETTDEHASAASTASSAISQREWRDDFMKDTSHRDRHIQIVTSSEDDHRNDLRKNLQTDEHVTELGQVTSSSDVKTKNRDNSVKVTSLVNSLVDTRLKNEFDELKKKHLITVVPTAPSGSKTFDYTDDVHKGSLNGLTATSSSSTYVKSRAENRNLVKAPRRDRTDVLGTSTPAKTIIFDEVKGMERDGSSEIKTSSDSSTRSHLENENIYNAIRDPEAVINTRKRILSSADMRYLHDLFDRSFDTGSKRVSMKDLSEVSLDPVFKVRTDNARRSKIMQDNSENSASAETSIEAIGNDRRTDAHKKTPDGNVEGKRRGLIGIISKSERPKGDEEVDVNLSAWVEAEEVPRRDVKAARRRDWIVKTSDAVGTLAEERARNKDKFDVLKEVEERAAAYAEASAAAAGDLADGFQRRIHAEKSNNRHRDNPYIAKEVRRTAAVSGVSSEINVPDEKKSVNTHADISNDRTGVFTFNDPRDNTEIQTRNVKDYDDPRSLGSAINNGAIRRLWNSASRYATGANKIDMELDRARHRINDGMLDTQSAVGPPRLKDRQRSSIETSLHLSLEECDEDAETKKFISEATSLYRMMNKQRDTEVLLMKRNPAGPVQVASLKNSVPPLIAYRLIPREVYERIGTIIANKRIFCRDCPLARNL